MWAVRALDRHTPPCNRKVAALYGVYLVFDTSYALYGELLISKFVASVGPWDTDFRLQKSRKLQSLQHARPLLFARTSADRAGEDGTGHPEQPSPSTVHNSAG